MFGARSVLGRIATTVRSIISPKAVTPPTQTPSAFAMPDTQETSSAEPVVSNSNATSEPSASPATAAGNDGPGKRKVRAQTTKERREYAKRKRLERQQEEPRERQPRPEGSEPRKPKRKVALLMGFCGTGFQGMQVNPNARTIEGELFKAMIAAGAVSEDNADDQSKVQFQRAARTDKGVHAAGQVVSLKMIIEDPDIVQKINEQLPEQIRLWGYVRVVKSFNSKTLCDSRIYEYLLPTHVLMPSSEKNAEIARTVEFVQRTVPEITPEQIEELRAYRASEEQLQFVRDALAKYCGTHDFRNFTVTRGCTESNSKRYIHSFTASDPMIIRGAEWISLKVKGQSFMLHQIRKMVGLVVLMARAGAPLKLIDALFASPRVNVPKAPGLGLLLEQPVFESFNRRLKNQRKDASSDPVTFEPYMEQINEFKQKFIYDAIVDTEMSDNVFNAWVQGTEIFPEPFTYVNKEGVIPEEALITPESERKWQQKMQELREVEQKLGKAGNQSDDDSDAAGSDNDEEKGKVN
ncbi:tRNA pseudouridine synthase 1 [Coemansia sp. RSA 2703]|nr:tRNA pseudouridine synthase 1 [Coemansia sp. RSA 2703]